MTDDPEPVDYQHWEIYLGSQFSHDADGWLATAPHLELNYGPLPNWQISAFLPLTYVEPDHESSHFGYGDTGLGIKYRFLQETDSHPQMAFYPSINVPTGNSNEGLGAGHVQTFLPLWMQKSIGPWTTFGGGGYWINPGEGNRNWEFVGWAAQYQLTKKFSPGVEIFHQTVQSEDERSLTAIDVGTNYDFDETNHLVFSVGHSILGHGSFLGYVAYELTFGPKNEKD
jgi:hypothetical protein